jgi:predicted DnaQ family exonuclease/DinG family helicase
MHFIRSGSNNIESFIAFDLETTGLAETDRIIEFGAAEFFRGEIRDTYQVLVNPQVHIPWEVYSLTGISPEEIQQAKPLHAIQDEILDFIGDKTLVAHNAPFDSSFLQRELSPLSNPVIDTLQFARTLLPFSTNHKLETLYDLFESDHPQFHRALDDAIATGKVFLHLHSLLEALPHEVLKTLGTVAETVHSDTIDLITRAMKQDLARKTPGDIEALEMLFEVPTNVNRHRSSGGSPTPEPTEKAVTSLLSDDAFLRKALGKYELRDEQVKLAAKVTQSLHNGEILIAEAGTGTGKTFAYLLPCVLWSKSFNERILVCTYTKNLEDQIFHRDLAAMIQSLDMDFSACLLKGRNNYLCQRRWEEMLQSHFLSLNDDEREALLKLIVWQHMTRTGDIAENSSFWTSEHFSLWARLSSDVKDCEMNSCRCFHHCYLAAIRKAAQEANIVVLNHALLFTDLRAEQKILGEYGRIVIDEAHNLEKAATDFLGVAVNSFQLHSILDRLARKERGLLPAIKALLALYGKKTSAIGAKLAKAIDAVDAARNGAAELFERIAEDVRGAAYRKSLRLKQGQRLTSDIEPYNQSLSESFAHITGFLHAFLEDAPKRLIELAGQHLVDEASQLLSDSLECSCNLFNILSCERNDHCYWMEVSDNGAYVKFVAAPIDVASILRTELFDTLASAVLVSATILVEAKFDYFRDKVGLTGYERAEEIALGSSFDYSRQVFSVAPLFISDPQQRDFAIDVADIIRKVVLGTRRGTLALFTSYKLLNGVYDLLIEHLHQNGILLLAQGRSGSRYTISREFREIKNSVLLGTYSFWEGFDVPGEALENLIITKLPFPAPNEPLTEARAEYLESRGLAPFDHLFVPEAIIRLRQGFGRLIRSAQDRGIIMILDTRIVRREYGKRFLLSLPTNVSASYYEEDFFESISKFWKE